MAKGSSNVNVALAVLVSLAVAGTGGYMAGHRIGQKSVDMSAGVVAKVNERSITKNELYDKMVETSGAQVVEDLIRYELVDQAAKNAQVAVTSGDVDKEINKIKESIGGEEPFQSALAQNNLTLERLKEQIAFQVKVTKILSKDIPVDDATLKQSFEESFEQYDTKREIKSRHILSETEEEAKATKAELDKGADFAELAKSKSIDPTAKDNGGDVGFNARGKMVAEYDKVVFALKKGEISQPFQSQFGWHVAQVTDVKGEAPTFESVKAEVQEAHVKKAAFEKFDAWYQGLKQEAKITNTLETKG